LRLATFISQLKRQSWMHTET